MTATNHWQLVKAFWLDLRAYLKALVYTRVFRGVYTWEGNNSSEGSTFLPVLPTKTMFNLSLPSFYGVLHALAGCFSIRSRVLECYVLRSRLGPSQGHKNRT